MIETTEPANLSWWEARLARFCTDADGNVDPAKWIALRDRLTLREFLILEEWHTVARDEKVAFDAWANANPKKLEAILREATKAAKENG